MDNRKKMPRIVCMTSDGYIDAVRPFIYLLKRYWGFSSGEIEVVVAGFSTPPFDLNDFGSNVNVKVKWHSIGKFEDYPIEKWSNSLIDLLGQIDDEYIILMLEDYWVIRMINSSAIYGAHSYMRQYPHTLKFDLAADRFFAGGATRDFMHHGWLDIVRSDPMSAYHMSLMTGMWNVELLKKVLLPDWNPWDVEIAGTTHLRNFRELDVVGSGQWPIKHTLAFRSGDSTKLLLEEIQQEDIYALRQLGFLEKWGM
jgi:hypothetical protein